MEGLRLASGGLRGPSLCQTLVEEVQLERVKAEEPVMTYRGHIENGKVVLAEDVALPEGTQVEVAVSQPPDASRDTHAPPANEPPGLTIEEKIARIVADVPDDEWESLPADLNEHLDHYIYGTPQS